MKIQVEGEYIKTEEMFLAKHSIKYRESTGSFVDPVITLLVDIYKKYHREQKGQEGINCKI